MGDPLALSVLQRKLHTCQVLLWLKQTYQVQDDGDFVLSKELVYQAYLAMSTTHEDLAALPHLTRPVLGKMVKRAFPSVLSIRRGPRGRVKQLYVGLVPQTHHSTRAGLDGRAKRLKKKNKKKMDEEEDEEVGHLLLGPFSMVGSPTRHRSDNEEDGEDSDNDGDGDGELDENGIITTTTITATTTDEEEQTRRCSLETTITTTTTTSPTTTSTPPTSSSSTTRSGSSSGDRKSPGSSLDSTIASPSSSSSSSSSTTTTTTSTVFFASSSPLPDTRPGPSYQGSEAAWNGGANRHRDLPNQPRPRVKVADMTDWARRAERLGRYRVMVAQTSSAGETGGRISVVEWVELIIPADLKPS